MNNFKIEIDAKSPSIINEQVLIKVNSEESQENFCFKFVVGIEGKWNTLRGYEKSNSIKWLPVNAGDYIIMVQIKQLNSLKPFDYILKEEFKVVEELYELHREEIPTKDMTEFEDKKTNEVVHEVMDQEKNDFLENIEVKGKIEKESVRIEKVDINKLFRNGKIEVLDLEVIPDVEGDFLYRFIITNQKERDVIGYSFSNFISFSPDTTENYRIETLIKDSHKEERYYDKALSYVYMDDKEGKYVDYTILNVKDYYKISDNIILDFNFTNKNIQDYKYLIKVDGIKIEESDFERNSRLHIKPKSAGIYSVHIGRKNLGEDHCIVKFKINSIDPVKIKEVSLDKEEVAINDFVTISVDAEGGKYILYEFYMKVNEKWEKVQKYSKKNFFTFMPLEKRVYNLFIVAKSNTSKDQYEDHYKLDIEV